MVPLGISVSTFAYGGSYCTKCFTEFKKKAEEEFISLLKTSKKIHP